MLETELIETIRRIKSARHHDNRFLIPIRDEFGSELGALVAIDAALSKDSDVVRHLTRWRAMFMRHFLTQFEATPERTASWLGNVVLPKNDRVLFLIQDERGVAIGNFGVCGISPQHAELDNLIRGEKGGATRLIFYSEVALLSWLYWSLSIPYVSLNVFSNNVRTITHHKRVGFTERETRKLSRIQEGREITYLVELEQGEPVEFSYMRMGMAEAQFYTVQPWANTVYQDFKSG